MYAHLTDLANRTPSDTQHILDKRTGFLDGYDIAGLGGRFAPYAALHCTLLAYQSLRYPGHNTERRIESMLAAAATLVVAGTRPWRADRARTSPQARAPCCQTI